MNQIRNKNLIENIKSIILVVLFLSTILLLYFFWEDAPFEHFTQKEDFMQHEVIKFDEILQPNRMMACLGGESYAIVENAFYPMIQSLESYSKNQNLWMEEITESQYKDSLTYPSLKAVFDYYVPFAAICEVFQIQKISGSDGVDALSEMAFSEAYPKIIFLFDQRNNKYYTIQGDSGNDFSSLSNIIVGASGSSTTYFTLKLNFGGLVHNQTLIPDSLESDLYDFASTPEFTAGNDEKVERVAKSFFSNNFDFVRKIEEQDGTVIYMYGFGKIVLIVGKNGTFEFKREDDEKSPAPGRYLEALDKTLNFIAAHGAFETLEGTDYEPCLKKVILIDAGVKKGYRFIFGLSVNNHELFYQNGEAVTVDVIGGKVTYFKRDLICYDADQIGSKAGNFREICSGMNVLAQNVGYINDILYRMNVLDTDHSGLTVEEILFVLAEQVDRLDYGYVRLEDEKERAMIRAAWILTIGQLEFYFDLDDGTPIGYSLK